MKQYTLYLTLLIWMCSLSSGCSDHLDDLTQEAATPPTILAHQGTRSGEEDSIPLLIFKTRQALYNAINTSELTNATDGIQIQSADGFVGFDEDKFQYLPGGGMMNKHPFLVVDGQPITYYEALGYDTLVPNVNFARLLNIKGELCVDSTVIKITPAGTFSFPLTDREECEEFINTFDVTTIPEDAGTYDLNLKVSLTRTFADNSLLEGGASDWTSPEEEDNSTPIQYEINGEPNFDAFSEFVAGSKTWIGKLIESIIGSNSTHSVYYADRSYRLRGKFYFYNYFFYAETGVAGWTDKKKGLFWHKEKCDELRIGWRRIRIRYSVDREYAKFLANLPSPIYTPPQTVIIDGKEVNMAVLVLPEYTPDMQHKLTQEGIQALYNLIRQIYHTNLPYTFNNANGCVIATPKYVYCELENHDMTAFNKKELKHVFSKNWLSFTIGWSNQQGFFFNNINQNNYNQVMPWVSTVFKAINTNPSKLLGGEVYICGRFGTSWRGMKIKKRTELQP